MDERNPSERSDASGDAPEQYRPTDRLVARLAELRSQLEVLAPQDQEKGREAIERIGISPLHRRSRAAHDG